MDCVFCKIAAGEIPTTLLYKDEQIVAFRDIHPLAPVHILIIPRKHVVSVVELTDEDLPLVAAMVGVAADAGTGIEIHCTAINTKYSVL